MRLKARTSDPSSSEARTSTRCFRLPLLTSRAASSRALIGTLICLARKNATHVAKNRTNTVISPITML